MMTEQIATKIKEELKKMNNSTDLGYTKTYIPWRNNDGFWDRMIMLTILSAPLASDDTASANAFPMNSVFGSNS